MLRTQNNHFITTSSSDFALNILDPLKQELLKIGNTMLILNAMNLSLLLQHSLSSYTMSNVVITCIYWLKNDLPYGCVGLLNTNFLRVTLQISAIFRLPRLLLLARIPLDDLLLKYGRQRTTTY